MLTFPSALATFWRIPLTAPCWTKTFTPRFSNNQIILVWNVSKNICYQGYPVHELSFLIFYAIPIFFLTFFYTCMINTIRRANTGIRRSAFRASNSNSKATDHRKQTIRMLGESHSVSAPSFLRFYFSQRGLPLLRLLDPLPLPETRLCLLQVGRFL